MYITADKTEYCERREEIVAARLVETHEVQYAENLLNARPSAVSFGGEGCVRFSGTGSFAVLDFGCELCGGVRIITRDAKGTVKWRVTFGESLTECYADIGYKNATNDHAPRDIEVITGMMSDLTFGQTGFRFVRLELIQGDWAMLQSVFAVSILPELPRKAEIVTDDAQVNQIIETALYTLKLNFQNGFIWDGIKRDRLVWCGDLHPEILTSLYAFGDTGHIQRSLEFLRETTPADRWINGIPTYSAWWVINLCDYCRFTGNKAFWLRNRVYALEIIRHFERCIDDDGKMTFGGGMEFFLDWSTAGTSEAVVGTASLIVWMAKKFLEAEEDASCRKLIERLASYLDWDTTLKPIRAFQLLAGRQPTPADAAMLQAGGAAGFSTFMAYYILSAMAPAGNEVCLRILKEYYGGMLALGATTFWEDFDISWMDGAARIDEIPKEGQKDIHGDFGKHCYVRFRHSLCHGWSAGVVSYVVEQLLGITVSDGGNTVRFAPDLAGLRSIEARLPFRDGWLTVSVHGEEARIEAPKGVTVLRPQN